MPTPAAAVGVRGPRFVLALFVFLAVATAASLLLFAYVVEPRFRPRIYTALAVDLLIPVVAWFVIAWMNRRRAQLEAPHAKQ